MALSRGLGIFYEWYYNIFRFGQASKEQAY